MTHPIIEHYRSVLRATDYVPATDAEIAAIRAAVDDARASAAIEGLEPDELDAAFSEMLFEEHAPSELRVELSKRFAAEQYGAGEAS